MNWHLFDKTVVKWKVHVIEIPEEFHSIYFKLEDKFNNKKDLYSKYVLWDFIAKVLSFTEEEKKYHWRTRTTNIFYPCVFRVTKEEVVNAPGLLSKLRRKFNG